MGGDVGDVEGEGQGRQSSVSRQRSPNRPLARADRRALDPQARPGPAHACVSFARFPAYPAEPDAARPHPTSPSTSHVRRVPFGHSAPHQRIPAHCMPVPWVP